MRPVAEWLKVPEAERAAYLEEWDRESTPSENWQRVPSRSIDVVSAQSLDELKQVERSLATATDAVLALTYKVASSREAGVPPGYVHPSSPLGSILDE